jgi:hypothetical protein
MGDYMKYIEQFNNRVNSSRIYPQDNFHFQDNINLLLKTFFEQIKNPNSVLIVGAGNLSDFSLSEFLRIFNEVVLSDVDEISMLRALSYQRLSKHEHNKIVVKKVEYTGFEEHDLLTSFKERFATCLNKEKIDQVLSHIFDTVTTYQFMKDQWGHYNFIYVSPIYTQLLYHQLSVLIEQLIASGYPEHLGVYIRESVLQHMPSVIDRFNQNLRGLLHEEGSMMVLSDVFELEQSSGFYRRVKNGIKNYDVMEEIYEGYKKKYGMGLGDYGLYNLDDKMQTIVSRWLIWPKNETSSYIVKLKIYNNKGGIL